MIQNLNSHLKLMIPSPRLSVAVHLGLVHAYTSGHCGLFHGNWNSELSSVSMHPFESALLEAYHVASGIPVGELHHQKVSC